MSDRVEHIDGSLVQHGRFSNRIYLMHLDTADIEGLIATLDDLARENAYGKILAKIPATAWPVFKSCRYIREAVVPGFFNGRIDGYFIAKYFSAQRQDDPSADKWLKAFGPSGAAATEHVDRRGRAGHPVVACQSSDAGEMGMLYRQVFQSYPFPICDPDYLTYMMDGGVRYFCVRAAGGIAAIAAAEIDRRAENAEMTDFATRPAWRGQGLAGMLLRHMECQLREIGIQTGYTIARVTSYGMNAVFRRNAYHYAGFLKNNTQIGGSIESMAVWYKRLSPASSSCPPQ